MKDIVEACGISRGGLYLYFANTKELFEALLEEECAGVQFQQKCKVHTVLDTFRPDSPLHFPLENILGQNISQNSYLLQRRGIDHAKFIRCRFLRFMLE